jgi:hypothetical protein
MVVHSPETIFPTLASSYLPNVRTLPQRCKKSVTKHHSSQGEYTHHMVRCRQRVTVEISPVLVRLVWIRGLYVCHDSAVTICDMLASRIQRNGGELLQDQWD